MSDNLTSYRALRCQFCRVDLNKNPHDPSCPVNGHKASNGNDFEFGVRQ